LAGSVRAPAALRQENVANGEVPYVLRHAMNAPETKVQWPREVRPRTVLVRRALH
jgi:hypothetical protein